MRCVKDNGNAPAFTLIELLVVIAVIAVLISMLLPAIKSAKSAARATVCATNLRSLGIAVRYYASDNGETLPYFAISSSIRWWTKIEEYTNQEAGAAVYASAPTYQTFGHNSVWSCPETQDNFWLGFGWNYHGLGHTPSDPRFGPTSIGQGKDDCYMLSDSAFAQDPDYAPTAYLGYDRLATPTGLAAAYRSRVHRQGVNVLYVAGYVEPILTNDFLLVTKAWGFFYN